MAHEVDLGDLGEARRTGAPQSRRQQVLERTLGDAGRRHGAGAPPGARLLEDRVDRLTTLGAGEQRGAVVARRRGVGALLALTALLRRRADHSRDGIDEGVELGRRALLGDGDEQHVVQAGHEAAGVEAGEEALRQQVLDEPAGRDRQPHGELAEDRSSVYAATPGSASSRSRR